MLNNKLTIPMNMHKMANTIIDRLFMTTPTNNIAKNNSTIVNIMFLYSQQQEISIADN